MALRQTVLSGERKAVDVASARREHLVETAPGLFSRSGSHATGIDTIRAAIPKTTDAI